MPFDSLPANWVEPSPPDYLASDQNKLERVVNEHSAAIDGHTTNIAENTAAIANLGGGTASGYGTKLTVDSDGLFVLEPDTTPINVGDIAATGTRDATTYLRGDGTWFTPATDVGTVVWSAITGRPSTFPPTIGATAADAVAGNDARLTDARTPTTHTHLVAQLSDASPDGRSLVVAADYAAMMALLAAEAVANKGAAGGYVPLNSSSKIDTTYLPAYVDDVLEFVNLAGFPGTGTTGLIYVALDTNKVYRWSGSTYVELSAMSTVDYATGVTGKPTTFAPIIGSGPGDAVAGNDARLTDARTPTTHTHLATGISDSTAVGRSLLTAVDAPAARTAIGAGTSSLVIGTSVADAKAGNYQPASANISDSTATGRAVLTAIDAPAARTAIGAGTSSLAIGTSGTTAAAGNDARLSDARTPTAHSHPATGISDSTATGRSLITAADAATARTAIGAAAAALIAEYLASATAVTVPAGVKGCWLTLIGQGGGAGSGRRGAAGSVRCGGGSGASAGMVSSYYISASVLGTTFDITIPTTANGGAAVTVNDTNGNNGGTGGDAVFSSGSFTIKATGAAGGSGGTALAGSGGGFYGVGLGIWGTTGASASTTGGAGASGGDPFTGGPAPGGAGGGLTSANVAANGGAGGGSNSWGLSGGAGGVVGGAAPGGGTALAGRVGAGGGGGASSVAGPGQAGADALGYGGGGGGGGASVNGQPSGAGGSGGPAYGRIVWDY